MKLQDMKIIKTNYKPCWIKHVILNGKIAVRNGSVCKGNYGKVLKFNIDKQPHNLT